MMYPSLAMNPELATWIERTAKTLAALGEEHRARLQTCNKLGEFPRDLYQEMGRLKLLGPLVPVEWGGIGGGVAEYAVISEEVGRHGLVSGQIAAQGQKWLLDWGSDEQKEQWLKPIAVGTAVFSESISEKGVGSSFKAMRATAVRDGDDWILNGSKTHVNLGAHCDVTLFYAIAPGGLTSFLVDMTLPGISTVATDPVGLRLIRTADVIFEDVRVPPSALLGPEGGGLQTFLTTFNISRLGNASELIGLGRRALELGLRYASTREVGTNMVTDFQGIQWSVADAWCALHGASLARDHAALTHQGGNSIAFETSVAKLLSAQAADRAIETAHSLVGGHGLYFDEPFIDIANDVKVLKVAGGSSEILRNYVARRIIGEPHHQGLS